MDAYRPDTRTAHERAIDDALDRALGDACWEPSDDDDLAAARGIFIFHGVALVILALCSIYIGIRLFDADPMHEPVEIGEIQP